MTEPGCKLPNKDSESMSTWIGC